MNTRMRNVPAGAFMSRAERGTGTRPPPERKLLQIFLAIYDSLVYIRL